MFFRIYADSEADNGNDNSNIGNKTSIIYKQNPVLNGYHKESELNDFLQSGFYESPVGSYNVDWFVNEVLKLENKMTFHFENTKKDIIMTQENREDFEKKTFVDFVKQKLFLIKLEITVI